MSRLRSPLCAALLVLAVLPAAVRAQAAPAASKDAAKDPALEEARKHVAAAKVHYDLGEFEQAAQEYITVYRIRPLPALLFNIAQAYRQASMYEKAKQFYKSYLRETKDPKNRAMIESAIKEIDELLAKDRKTRDTGPSGVAAAPPEMAPKEKVAEVKSPVQDVVIPPAAAPEKQAPAPARTAQALPPVSAPVRPAPPASKQETPVAKTDNASSKSPITVAMAATPRSSAPTAATQPVRAAPEVEESEPLYKKWWLWTAVGVVAAGAGVLAVTSGGNAPPASQYGTSKVF